MTEQEWLACADPVLMLEFLRGPASTETKVLFGRETAVTSYKQRRISERKARLFGCACCRRLWHLLDEEHGRRLIEAAKWASSFEGRKDPEPPLDCCRRAVELAERSADEPVSAEEMRALSEAAFALYFPSSDYCACYGEEMGPFDADLVASGSAAYAVHHACENYPPVVGPLGQVFGAFDSLSGVIWRAAQAAAYLNSKGFGEAEDGGDSSERAAQCALLREVVGNPFREVLVDRAWHSWNDATVVKLAQGVYDERAFDRLSVLADALEEAGCDNADILTHCRQPGEHVRGCWVVDLLLGKG